MGGRLSTAATGAFGPPARRTILTAGGVAGLLLLASAALPEPAYAGPADDLAKRIIENVLGLPNINPFGSESYFNWLTKVPNYADQGHVAVLGGFTQAAGLALLSAVVTLAIIHYWVAGFTGGGEITQGLFRSVGAAMFITAWPFIAVRGRDLVNALSESLVDFRGSMEVAAEEVITIDQNIEGAFGFFAGFLVSLLFLALLLLLAFARIGLNAGWLVIWLAAPIAVAVWPVPGFAWLGSYALRAATAIFAVGVTWAVLIAAVVAVGTDVVVPNDTRWANTFIKPFVWFAVMILMFKIPGLIMRATGAAPGGGFMRFAAGVLVGRIGGEAIRRHLPDRLGGTKDTVARQQEQYDAWKADQARRGHVHGLQIKKKPGGAGSGSGDSDGPSGGGPSDTPDEGGGPSRDHVVQHLEKALGKRSREHGTTTGTGGAQTPGASSLGRLHTEAPTNQQMLSEVRAKARHGVRPDGTAATKASPGTQIGKQHIHDSLGKVNAYSPELAQRVMEEGQANTGYPGARHLHGRYADMAAAVQERDPDVPKDVPQSLTTIGAGSLNQPMFQSALGEWATQPQPTSAGPQSASSSGPGPATSTAPQSGPARQPPHPRSAPQPPESGPATPPAPDGPGVGGSPE